MSRQYTKNTTKMRKKVEREIITKHVKGNNRQLSMENFQERTSESKFSTFSLPLRSHLKVESISQSSK